MRTRINLAASDSQPNRKLSEYKSKAFAIASNTPQGDTPRKAAEIIWRLA